MKRKFYIYKNGNYYEDSTPGLVDVTYAQIKTLRDGSALTPGAFYRITDYQCTTAQTNTSSAGHLFDIIVLALENNKLSEEAWAAHHAGDTYFANSKLEAWRIWYCLDNDATRFAWALAPVGEHLIYSGGTGSRLYYREPQYDGVNGNYCWSNLSGNWYIFTDTLEAPATGSFWKLMPGGTWNKWIDTISVQYVPATTAEGKGIIYRMVDEFGNDVPYDFKNILFTSSGKYTNAYTFSVTESSAIKDASILGLSKLCYGNIMKKYIVNDISLGTRQQLNFNVFYSTSTYFGCYSNTFGNNCYSNTFGEYCYSNTFGNNCYSNTFGEYCYSNTFGEYCYSNTFGDYCESNAFGPECRYNTFGLECDNNTFGPGCNYNTLGNKCGNNTFGNGCLFNTFGTSSSAINNCRYIALDDGCSYLYIDSADASASYDNYLQNVHIHAGVQGTSSSNRRTITIPDRNLAYSTDYYANGSQTVILD